MRLDRAARSANLRLVLIATLAFSIGSATVVTAGPTISGFVGLIDGANTAAINADRELSVNVGNAVALAPATRSQNVQSPPGDLGDQQIQNVTFPAITTSLLTVANLGGTGNRSFMVVAYLTGGGHFTFIVNEGAGLVSIPLAQPAPIDRLWIRCDSFSTARCRYEVSLVGN